MKPFPVFFTKTADEAIREASAWWFENRLSAPNAIAEEIERALALVCAQPGIGSRALNIPLAGVRRVHLSRIHYYLYYRISPLGTHLEVLAFWHTSRAGGPQIQEQR